MHLQVDVPVTELVSGLKQSAVTLQVLHESWAVIDAGLASTEPS